MHTFATNMNKVKKQDFRIVFMGTPDFAVPSLTAIVEAGYSVAGVITAPDKPAGRGKKIHMSAVKAYALAKGLRILQPVNLKAPDFVEELKMLKADLQVVVAFRMLPEIVWAMPPYGTINLHASLLPQYRGAAPIHHAIMNGEQKTGLTTFLLQKEIDTGQILMQKEIPIGPNDNVGQLHDKMMNVGAGLLVETIELIRAKQIQPQDQSTLVKNIEILKPAPKIFKEDCLIDWNNDARSLHNFIRGLSPYPTAYSTLLSPSGESFQMKIFKATPEISTEQLHPGTIVTDGKQTMKVACVDGFIRLLEVQQSGKKRMPVSDFLRGFHLDEEWKFL